MARLSTTASIRVATQLAERGQKILLDAIRDKATKMVRRYPFVVNYDQSMGSASVKVKIIGSTFYLSLYNRCSDIRTHFIWDNLTTVVQDQVEQLDEDMKKLHELHEAWDGLYSGALSGEPLTIERSGKIIKER